MRKSLSKRLNKRKTFKNNKSLKKNNTNNNSLSKFEQEIVVKYLEVLNLVKLYHWKTMSFAKHKATDELYTRLNKHIDEFVEVLLGKRGDRINLMSKRSIALLDVDSSSKFKVHIEQFRAYLIALNDNPAIKSAANTDLYNIRDEILGDINQFLYLLTFTK